jgi:hypothetical protein
MKITTSHTRLSARIDSRAWTVGFSGGHTAFQKAKLWTGGENMKRWLFLIVALIAFSQPLRAAPYCCTVTAIDARTGTATAVETATGRTFEFHIPNPRLFATVRVGTPVYANFSTKQVSLDGKTPCGVITKIDPAPAAAPPTVTAPGPTPPSPQTMIVNPHVVGPENAIFKFTLQNPGGICTGGLRLIVSGPVISMIPPNHMSAGDPINGQPPPACTIVATLYRGVTLSNGWTVREVAVRSCKEPNAPNLVLGTISPNLRGGTSLQMEFQSSATYDNPYPTDSLVEVTIQGPRGTTPSFNLSKADSDDPGVPKSKAAGIKQIEHPCI